MARIRSIKPDACTDERLGDCSSNARLLNVYLPCFCDDGGVHPAKPRTLKAEVFPMDDFPAEQVSGWVDELIGVGLLSEFEAADGQRYWHVCDWSSLQKIDKPSRRYPQPGDPGSNQIRPMLAEHSANARRTVVDDSPAEGMEGREGGAFVDKSSKRTPARSKATPKSALPEDFSVSDRVRAWAADKGFDRLDEHLESFRLKATAKSYCYADWDAAFMGAITDDWAKLRDRRNGAAHLPGTGVADLIRRGQQ